ncbi:biotin--[acetyl-CoA-carboxylase] ligase [Endothiovibrio diazotrophicus]
MQPLQRDELLAALPDPRLLAGLELLDEVDSTNARLLAAAREGAPGGSVCIAERQRAGRGRSGRCWVSPPGGNLYLSLLWRFSDCAAVARGLSLALGVAVLRVVRQAGASEVGLKWPNDLHWRGRKLAGLLVEASASPKGCAVVAGVGLNLRMPRQAGEGIEQPWIDLETILGGELSRSLLAGRLIGALLGACEQFQAAGLAPFRDEWRGADLLADHAVIVRTVDGREAAAVARGIDGDGALLVEIDGALRPLHAGEVSIRRA